MEELCSMGMEAAKGAQVALDQTDRFNFHPSVQGGVHSYGRVIGTIASIAIVILLVAVPLFYAFKVVYSKIRTNEEVMESVRMNLAENRLQALQKVGPELPFQEEGFRIGAKEYKELIALGYAPARIEVELMALFRGEDLSLHPDHPLMKLFNKERVLKDICVRELARYTANLEKVGIPEKELIDLAQEAKQTRHLQAFLLKKGCFGSDPKSETFQAGMEVIQYLIDFQGFEKHALEINEILDAIKDAPKESLEQYLQIEVRARLDQLQKSIAYKVLLKIEGREHSFVKAVQDLSLALRLDSRGMTHLQDLGRRYVSLVKDEFGPVPLEGSVGYLANALDETIGKYHWSYKIESLFDKLLVYRRYPEKTAMAYLSHKPDRALDYNSYQVGNFDMAFGEYGLGRDRIRAIHGPTPTSDQLLIAQLEAQRECRGIHLQHNLEHPAFSRGDRARIEYLLEVEKAFPETFRLMSTPLDGPAMRLEGMVGNYFKRCQTVQEFFLKYGTYAFTGRTEDPARAFSELDGEAHRIVEARRDNGFYLGKDVMTDDQFRLAFECASEAFSFVNLEAETEKKRLARALQVGVQGFIAVGAVVKTLQDAYSSPSEIEEALLRASFGQACKLDIDRGVILNVMTRVYFHVAAGKSLTEDDIAEIIGTVVGRAELVSGRTIIFDRYQPLSDALRLIGVNEEHVRGNLQRYVQEGFGVDPSDLEYQSSS